MSKCYNRGCGQTFNPNENTDKSCRHHPGVPYFHDAYKGWSCCKKQSVDFTEFLNIAGCTLSKHSDVKPPEPVKQVKEQADVEPVEVRKPIRKSMVRPPITTPMTQLQPSVAPTLKEQISKLGKAAPAATKAEGVIEVGTSCKNNGCNSSYTNTSKDFEECQYHPGVAIFHEGLKFWSCCEKRTSNFDNFLAQKGCRYGAHKWICEDQEKAKKQCRYDWHQTPENVIVTIYAKMYHYETSTIEVNPIRLLVNLVFPPHDHSNYVLDLELGGVTDPGRVKAFMGPTKVEITLPKAEPGTWAKLNIPAKIVHVPKVDSEINKNIPEPPKGTVNTSEDDFDLDDIETVDNGFKLAEIKGNN